MPIYYNTLKININTVNSIYKIIYNTLKIKDNDAKVTMINAALRSCIAEILSFLDEEAVFSLARTVTQGLLKNKLETRQDAVEAILHYSQDELSLLKRKSVTRDALFQYLHRHQIKTRSTFTKTELIDYIATHWESLNKENRNTEAVAESSTIAHVSLLAENFAKWFYTLFNTNELIPVEHFYSDASMCLKMFDNNKTLVEECLTSCAEDTVKQLCAVKNQFSLHFNPNLTPEGTQGRINPHGLVLVLACGTLHANNNCIGLFEQVFVLARDPFSENNWRIKSTELNLKSQTSNNLNQPKLIENDLTAQHLSLPSS